MSINTTGNVPPYTFPNGTVGESYETNLTRPNPLKRLSFIVDPAQSGVTFELVDLDGNPNPNIVPGMRFSRSPLSSTRLYILVFTGIPTTAGIYSFGIKATSRATQVTFTPYTIEIILTCVASNTMVLMADNTEKYIQHIRRGEVVAGNISNSKQYTVSKVLCSEIGDQTEINMVEFPPNSIGESLPNKSLIMTSGHPIIINSERRGASLFSGNGITKYDKTEAHKILPKIKSNRPYVEEERCYLWDLQFDTVGSFVANGVTVQSRHPQSYLTPLDKDLYIDQSLYSEETKNDHDHNYEFPLVYTPFNVNGSKNN